MAPDTARTAPSWFKSSYSEGNSGCVELSLTVPGRPAIRDSKLGTASPILLLTPRALQTFLEGTARGDFD
ncbi:DUF397 domain-containing protein [Pseudonocardia spinosispora]|uniref:DUF397 domain-containing protein n=1 Tax=Pseudonocardia spinosispora TaxID=103441 RepID=UPI000409A0BA|nr:DUF397 domain-containing protein [Pseudonocardia spinosispora]